MAKTILPAPNISPFDGDPETLPFFKEQVFETARINKWLDEHTIYFIKNNLKGQALTYFKQQAMTRQFKSPQEIFDLFEKFFKQQSRPQALAEFFALKLLPGEAINNLAHRIDCAAAKAHPNITQIEALNEIKFAKLLQILPNDMRSNILKNNINSYDKAIESAQHIMDCKVSNEVLNHLTEKPNDELKILREEVNFIKKSIVDKSKEKECSKPYPKVNSYKNHNKTFNKFKNRDFPKNISDRNFLYKPKFPFKKFKQNAHFQQTSFRACHFCGSLNHLMKQCKKLKFQQNQCQIHQNPFHTQQVQQWMPGYMQIPSQNCWNFRQPLNCPPATAPQMLSNNMSSRQNVVPAITLPTNVALNPNAANFQFTPNQENHN